MEICAGAARREDRLTLAGKPQRDVDAIMKVVAEPDAPAHHIQVVIALTLPDYTLALAKQLRDVHPCEIDAVFHKIPFWGTKIGASPRVKINIW